MSDDKELLRSIPKVDELMSLLSARTAGIPQVLVKEQVRSCLEELRRSILAGSCSSLPGDEAIAEEAMAKIRMADLPSLRPVINGTGIAIHTNLGRSCLSRAAADAVKAVAEGYSTLEYDVEKGQRGSRHSHIEDLICRVTGAQAAMVVNNNAGAVLLVLSEMGQGGEVVTSRGELVEIGGSFRIPEIMQACGCTLREVGATNKTHLSDYENAINSSTKALLKVHTSNYRIVGFFDEVSLEDMVALGKRSGLPVIQDLGSGCLISLKPFGIYDEPTVQESVSAGVDIITFSGDKLLGGAQAGIILGKKEYIERLKQHPLARALRVDKMTLAALRETLYAYLDEERAKKEIPTLSMIGASDTDLKSRALLLADSLEKAGFACSVCDVEDQVGGGSVPTKLLKGYGVAIDSRRLSVDRLEEKLRRRALPVIGRIHKDQYLLSVRTLLAGDTEKIIEALTEIIA